MKTAKTPPRLRVVDDQLNALIPETELPFIGLRTRGKQQYFDGWWKVNVPDNLRDAQQRGREMALAFLRAEPHNGDRQTHLDWLSLFVLSGQTQALNQGGNAAQMVYSFWGTVASFAEPCATLANVERYRTATRGQTEHRKRQEAEYEAERHREHSERSREAAIAGWAKRRRTAKRGKAVRQ